MSPHGMICLTDELSELNLGDARLNQRACHLIETLGQHPGRSIPAAYRLLEPHYRCTRERMMEQDTGKNDIDGLGTLNYENRRGFYLHPTLAVTPQRLPLGILDSWSWARPLEEAKESIRWVEGYQRINELQQHLWEQAFDTHLVYMADREADLFAIYAEHQQQQQAGLKCPQ